MLQAQEAISPDGRRVAKLTTEYFQTLHLGEESMTATVTVTDRETGEPVYVGHFSYDRNRRMVESGHEVTGIAFDGDGTLLVGSRDEHVERVPLPAPGQLSSLQAAARARAALTAAYAERGAVLADVVAALFWDGGGLCRMCGWVRPQTATVYVCSDCARVCARRIATAGQPPDLSMTLAETERAVSAHAVEPEQVMAALSARAAKVPAGTRCTVCFEDPKPDPLDLWSAVGRACASCIRRHQK